MSLSDLEIPKEWVKFLDKLYWESYYKLLFAVGYRHKLEEQEK